MQDINHLINQKESRKLQFEAHLPDTDSLIKAAIAFSNCQGGDLIIGVDKNNTAIGVDKQKHLEQKEIILSTLYTNCFPHIIPEIYSVNIKNKRIILVHFNSSMQKPHYFRSKGRQDGTFIRGGYTNKLATSNDLENLERYKRRQNFELNCDYDITYDLSFFTVFCQHVIDKLDKEPDASLLEELRLIKKEGDLLKLTNLGILLSDLKMEIFPSLNINLRKMDDSKEIIDSHVFDNDLISAIEKVISRLKAEFLSQEKNDTFLQIIKELLINAVIHRDYSLRSNEIEIIINKNFVEIINPGTFAIEKEMLVDGYSSPVNPYLHNLLSLFGLTNNERTGYQKVRDISLNMLEVDIFIYESSSDTKIRIYKGHPNDPDVNGCFKINFINEPNNDPKTILKVPNKIVGDPIKSSGAPKMLVGVPNERYEVLLSSMIENCNISIKKLADILKVSEKTVKRYIEKLKRNGIIRRIGQRRNGYWEVIE